MRALPHFVDLVEHHHAIARTGHAQLRRQDALAGNDQSAALDDRLDLIDRHAGQCDEYQRREAPIPACPGRGRTERPADAS